jgi:O-glycosyl hydrolase
MVSSELPSVPSDRIDVSSTQVQYIRGFGGMSNAFWIGPEGIARYMELRDIDTMFHPETGLGYNILRIHIFPHPLEEILRGQHYPQMGNQIYARLVQRVNQYGGYVLASPWTPPAEFKTNNSTTGNGFLRTDMYAAYARYLRDFARGMAQRGAPLYAVSIQNEPTHEATYYGMLWEGEHHRRFLAENAQIFHDANIPGFGGGKAGNVKLMGGSPHNQIRWNEDALNDPVARANLDIVAYHTYGNLNTRYPLARDLSLGRKEIWMTEKNHNSGSEALYPNDHTWDYVWHVANEINHSLINVDSSAYVWWYAKRFYSMIGEGAFGTVNGQVLPRGWVMSHYAKYATDTVRLETTDNLPTNSIGVDTIAGRRFGISAYIRKSIPDRDDFEEAKLKVLEDSVSLVVYDRDTNATGSRRIRINLPAGFVASNAFGIISDGNVFHAPVVVVLGHDGTYGDIELPANTIISVRFVK